MKNFFILLILISWPNLIMGYESKIIYKIENEIITNIDIKNEYKYLLVLNNNLQNLTKEEIFKISKASVIKEKIKKIEILKNFESLEVDENYLNKYIENIYKQRNLSTINEYQNYLKKHNLELDGMKNKLKIEIMWNEMIIKKYSTKVFIDMVKIKKNLLAENANKTKKYLLSEILYEIKDKYKIKKKYKQIKESIKNIGFENTASTFSISDTSKIGGKLGWVNESSLNKEIRQKISGLDIGDHTGPIIINGGILIIKVNEIKEEENNALYEEKLKKIINYERNKQLNDYSKIYFNKVKKNLNLSEY